MLSVPNDLDICKTNIDEGIGGALSAHHYASLSN